MHLFYQPLLKKSIFKLENEEHHHCINVLRHKVGDTIHVTDGKGDVWLVSITEVGKKFTAFTQIEKHVIQNKDFNTIIAISPTKQIDRMEWFVEKACELGVDTIYFIQTKNSERNRLKLDRLEKKTVSALKQSKSGYKTELKELTSFKEFIKNEFPGVKKFIAKVDDSSLLLAHRLVSKNDSFLFLIGPEGDFTDEEVLQAEKQGFIKISLGNNVLRTETAGVYVAGAIYFAKGYRLPGATPDSTPENFTY
jgi:16S rRNA (uracil1498-N3)-methyltransferase